MNGTVRLLIILSIVGTLVSAARTFPHQLAYFNELSGGPYLGYTHLLGSNLDWNQDAALIAKHVTAADVGNRPVFLNLMYSTSDLYGYASQMPTQDGFKLSEQLRTAPQGELILCATALCFEERYIGRSLVPIDARPEESQFVQITPLTPSMFLVKRVDGAQLSPSE